MAKQKMNFNLSAAQLVSLVGIVITATVTVLSYTSSTSAKITALDTKIDNKIDSTNFKIDKINDNLHLVIGFFNEKNEILRYLASNKKARKEIIDTIVYPNKKSRIASKDCYAIDNVNLEDNYIHAIERDQ